MNNTIVDLIEVLSPTKKVSTKTQPKQANVSKLGLSWGRPLPKKETSTPSPTKKTTTYESMPMSEYQHESEDKPLVQDTYSLLFKER